MRQGHRGAAPAAVPAPQQRTDLGGWVAGAGRLLGWRTSLAAHPRPLPMLSRAYSLLSAGLVALALTACGDSVTGDRCTKGCACGRACIDCSKTCTKNKLPAPVDSVRSQTAYGAAGSAVPLPAGVAK